MSEYKTSPYAVQLREAKRQMGRIEEERDALRAELKTVKAVLADALAERLPPWLAGLMAERQTLIFALREAADGGGTCCGGHALSWHYAACRVGKLLRIIGDGETERQVDSAWDAAIYEDSVFYSSRAR